MTDDGIFLRDSWYVAAWNHELIDGTKLGSHDFRAPRGDLSRRERKGRGARRPLLPSRGSALDGPDRRRRYPMHVPWHEVRCGGQVHPDPRPGDDSAKLGVRSYPIVERYNLIWIWMGDAEKADPNLIVDYPPLADAKSPPPGRSTQSRTHQTRLPVLSIGGMTTERFASLRATHGPASAKKTWEDDHDDTHRTTNCDGDALAVRHDRTAEHRRCGRSCARRRRRGHLRRLVRRGRQRDQGRRRGADRAQAAEPSRMPGRPRPPASAPRPRHSAACSAISSRPIRRRRRSISSSTCRCSGTAARCNMAAADSTAW